MTDRPILFSAPMVRALVREARAPGTGKTQTRRILKAEVPLAPGMDEISPNHVAKHPAPYLDAYCGAPKTSLNPRGMSDRWCWWTRDDRPGPQFRVPFVPGDRLWVRETWAVGNIYDGVKPSRINPTGKPNWCGIRFAATDDRIGIHDRPSLFMPRWASRLTLHVTDVRVERLQDISEADAKAEGLACLSKDNGQTWKYGIADRDGWPGTDDDGWPWFDWDVDPRLAYARLWNRLHGRDAWDRNPWLVAITFRTALANIDEPEEIDPEAFRVAS